MQSIWHDVRSVLSALGCAESIDLHAGAAPQQVQALEEHLGQKLPLLLKELLLVHDGQVGGPGLVYGYALMSTEQIRSHWDDWRSIEAAGMNEECADFMSSSPPGVVKPLYTNAKWIPFAHDHGGNHFGIDFDPAESGSVGQIIAFGRDMDEKQLKAVSIESFFAALVSDLGKASWNANHLEWPLMT